MRYYGMSNPSPTPQPQPQPQTMPMDNQMPQNNLSENIEEALPQTPNQSNPTESQTFNRPGTQSGIYQGQQAQNVRPINEWPQDFPPAVMPPGSNPSEMGFSNATIYEYPAPPAAWPNRPQMPDRSCPAEMGSVTYLCSQKGKIFRVEMGDGVTKSGILRSVGRNYIILEESGSGNHIMCTMGSIKSIDIFNSRN